MTPEENRGWFREIYRNLPNIVSILGVVPLSILFLEDGFSYVPALIVYNNFMDDLDGILARELGLSSDLGARLDNVADAVASILIAFAVGAEFGGIVLGASAVAAVAVLIRIGQRLGPSPTYGIGSPTNELMRQLLFVVVLQNAYGFDITVPLVAIFLINSASMLVPFPMPQLIRARTTSVVAILLVNVALVAAWLVPETAPFVAAAFFGTYFYSFAANGVSWLRGGVSPEGLV
jgi:phosphatidylserine synthase